MGDFPFRKSTTLEARMKKQRDRHYVWAVGQIVLQGTVKDIVNNENVHRAFLG
jgi:ABC-type lipopolysaccharide export system ATPase subunit